MKEIFVVLFDESYYPSFDFFDTEEAAEEAFNKCNSSTCNITLIKGVILKEK